MGLLEDAIKEHLDLKRQQGADENEIEELNKQAFGPEEPAAAPAVPESATAQSEAEAPPVMPTVDPPTEAHSVPEPEPEAAENEAPVEPEVAEPAAEADVEEPEPIATEPEPDFDSEPEPLSSPGTEIGAAGGDVLEETPEFLEGGEDDQLWFEQKPPKDFDFND